MKRNQLPGLGFVVVLVISALSFPCISAAQSKPATPDSDVITKQITSVGYTVGGGGTKIDLVPTLSAQYGGGEAKIDAKKKGVTNIDAKVTGLPQPNTLGSEFLTYVLWSVTPDGSTTNLGEIRVDKNGNGSLQTTAQSQTFALGVTAEPYYAVALPSEVVVLINDTRKKTQGKIFPENSYKLMKRSQYALQGNPLALTLDLKSTPLDAYEARNAVEIAKSRGAEKYAPEILTKAVGSLAMMEQALASKDNKATLTNARQTIQFAEDARAYTAVRQEAERIQNEKDAAAAAAKAEADRKAALEARRQAELTAAREAQMKAEAEKAQAEAQAKAEKARLEAEAQQAAEQARTQAAKDEAERARAATAAMRAQLLAQLNAVLQTTDTPRGLMVNMADVLFAIGKYDLKPDTKVKLAQLSGIILSHPGLNLAIEGYTDNIGSDELNMKLSQQRADTVRGYLVQMGLKGETITAVGLGKASPVADNSTNAGRQQNRRVEIIVSGDIIGGKL